MALIGDIVGSRRSLDREELHGAIESALAIVNDGGGVLQPAVITLGDEFQAVYASLGQALGASFSIRTRLFPYDVRFGLGRGEALTLDVLRGIHDGSAYWAAREAIEHVESQARRAAVRLARTCFRSEEDPPALVAAVNAALLGVDQLVGSMSEVSRRILARLVDGATQKAVADSLGVTAPAVSQRVIRDGIAVVREQVQMLSELR